MVLQSGIFDSVLIHAVSIARYRTQCPCADQIYQGQRAKYGWLYAPENITLTSASIISPIPSSEEAPSGLSPIRVGS